MSDVIREVHDWLVDALSRNQIVHPVDRERARDFVERLAVSPNSETGQALAELADKWERDAEANIERAKTRGSSDVLMARDDASVWRLAAADLRAALAVPGRETERDDGMAYVECLAAQEAAYWEARRRGMNLNDKQIGDLLRAAAPHLRGSS